MYWKDGLRLESSDENILLRLGGRFQYDLGTFDADRAVVKKFGDESSNSEIRRARVYLSGLLYDTFEFKIQYDFAGSDPDFKDLYFGIRDLPNVGNLYVGHFKEPFGMETLTSSKYTTFIEHALPLAFAPERNTGIMVNRAILDERMTWAIGVFDDTRRSRDSLEGNGCSISSRITGLPWYESDEKFLHLGAAFSYREPDNNSYRENQKPESNLLENFVKSSSIETDNVILLGTEAALDYGPFSLQTKYIHSFVDSIRRGQLDFEGFYIQGSYFLTGEHRKYVKEKAIFDKIPPHKNILEDGGFGAWEIAFRYSQIDLNDQEIDGGRLDDLSAGLNWYLNSNARVTFNYIHADLDEIGEENAFQMRYQIAF